MENVGKNFRSSVPTRNRKRVKQMTRKGIMGGDEG